jgi:hypothetical protein
VAALFSRACSPYHNHHRPVSLHPFNRSRGHRDEFVNKEEHERCLHLLTTCTDAPSILDSPFLDAQTHICRPWTNTFAAVGPPSYHRAAGYADSSISVRFDSLLEQQLDSLSERNRGRIDAIYTWSMSRSTRCRCRKRSDRKACSLSLS